MMKMQRSHSKSMTRKKYYYFFGNQPISSQLNWCTSFNIVIGNGQMANGNNGRIDTQFVCVGVCVCGTIFETFIVVHSYPRDRERKNKTNDSFYLGFLENQKIGLSYKHTDIVWIEHCFLYFFLCHFIQPMTMCINEHLLHKKTANTHRHTHTHTIQLSNESFENRKRNKITYNYCKWQMKIARTKKISNKMFNDLKSKESGK